uniref:Reverse transcriptase domain-containing protein n=1 Tax=Xiphophorus maculatus TaxID=8083 RepID=A0A3B5QKI5_XIPMA
MEKEQVNTQGRWRFKDADWRKYEDMSENRLINIDINKSINELNLEVSKSIIEVAKEAIPKGKGIKKKRIVPWWNIECTMAIKARNKAFKTLKKDVSFQNLISYKRKQAEVRRKIRNAKKFYWSKYCESLGKTTALDRVWNTIKKMSGKSKEYKFSILKNNGNMIIEDKDKVELLVKVLAKVHSNENLSKEEKEGREFTMRKYNERINEEMVDNDTINMKFSMTELKKALKNTKNSTPGEDQINYVMLKNLNERSKLVLLKLYNKIWEEGTLPDKWKESIIIPICKPGKDPQLTESYRPIALTSCVGKVMERMVNNRLIYFLESREKIKKYQYGFRKGRSTTDPMVQLEHEIRKAQVNKEVLMAVFLDIEKAYDMLWKEGLLIKIRQIGLSGKIYNWIKDFLTDRNIRVKIGNEVSSKCLTENGTPQGSIISPMLFIIMINDIFSKIEGKFGMTLFADDGLIWKRGRNITFLNDKMQEALGKVEDWALEWGFRISSSKSKFVNFTNRKVGTKIKLKMYDKEVERVDKFKYLGLWFDKKLTWKIHISKIIERSKKILNIMRCLRGKEWGAGRKTLKILYIGLIRSVIDYGCVVYNSASSTLLKEIDKIQYQALRICCGAMKTTPVSALQVEMGEMPLELRRKQLGVGFWANVKGHKKSYPINNILQPCQESVKNVNVNSFGWIVNKEIKEIGLDQCLISPVVDFSCNPPWIQKEMKVDLTLLEEGRQTVEGEVERYVRREYGEYLQIYTDASKMVNDRVGIAFIIPDLNIMENKRLTDSLNVYTGELLAISMALKWSEELSDKKVLICSDSSSALISIMEQESEARQDILIDINKSIHKMGINRSTVKFIWIPAHIGIVGNELADTFAKSASKRSEIELKVKYSKNEIKSISKIYYKKKWQEQWEGEKKARFYYSIQKKVGECRKENRNKQEEDIISRLRFGHVGLNSTLKIINKHSTGLCNFCGKLETVIHIFMECNKYNLEREELVEELNRNKVKLNIRDLLQKSSGDVVFNSVFRFLRKTGLIGRL